MDPIEPAGDSNAHGASSASENEGSSSRPTLSVLQTQVPPNRARSNRARRPSIRLQRISSSSSFETVDGQQSASRGPTPLPALSREVSVRSPVAEEDESPVAGRRRSSSEPRPGRWATSPDVLSRANTPMPMSTVHEGSSHQGLAVRSPQPQDGEEARDYLSANNRQAEALDVPPATLQRPASRSRLRRTSQAAMRPFTRNRASTISGGNRASTISGGNRASTISGAPSNDPIEERAEGEYGSHLVDVLDVIDPEVSALSTLTNVQNSLFIPNLGGWVNRMPTYTISRAPKDAEKDAELGELTEEGKDRTTLEHLRPFSSMSSVLVGPRYAVMPEGQELEGWTSEDFAELNDHVRHMLHSRRSKFKRAMKGFGKYVSKPLGFLVTLYATLITLFGLAWVLFLIGWINVHGKQSYLINIIDNVLVALFAIMGDGLAPFRAVDTYHMIYIAHYTHLTWNIRKKRKLPGLKDKNDLPEKRQKEAELEENTLEDQEYSVLNPEQQLKLIHHQTKFAKSHTFYKPHETMTHYAFPLRMLVAIVVILDFHSILQMALGACTWSMEPPKYRPFALTTVILCCSITCNITGGVLIMIGDHMTRKKDIVERLFRQELTAEAMKKMKKRKAKEERLSTQIERPEPFPGT
ncbi:hypothetical protein N7470_006211 [Penicillium chermesinum]|nr:hypothetical protein N7470_006211 [Penicillium chermesinum]